MGFMLFSALLPSAKCEVKLENPSKEQLAAQIANFSHLISANIYNYSPVSYEKIKTLVPKKSGSIKETLSQYTPSKLAELLKPAITLKLEPPTDESQVKKFKQKQKALEEISVCAFLHVVYCQFYPQLFTSSGNPPKPEVRIASNLPEWQIVKKIDVQRQERKEVFMTLANIYHSIHNKYPSFSPITLSQTESGRKSYSTLLSNLSLISSASDFDSEWKAFEAFNSAGFPPVPSTQTIGALYPELKIPKPRGNFGKKKK
ncbi:MAG: hypothetical protein Q8R15_02860 [Candidatus Micrarchaeota archaeon]|nr:hypothetical protein [Candidatus Micrarchaeota archaeon]